MTLLVVAHAKDCIVALSDRKETIGGGSRYGEVTKYHLDAVSGFYMALAGDGTAAGIILNKLKRSHVPRFGVFREIERLAAEAYAAHDAKDTAGHLIVSDGGGFMTYGVRIAAGSAAFYKSDDGMSAEGDRGAIAICKNLAQDMGLTNMPCNTAVKFLHTLAARVAKTVDTVGGRSEYGIDIVVFAKAGTVRQIPHSTDKMGAIHVRFEESSGETYPGPNGGS